MGKTDQRLAEADDLWSEGRLRAARELYGRLEALSWHAAFQAAWIDAAFGPVSDDRLAALDREGLSQDARELVEIVTERVRDREPDEILPGTVDDWDLDSLRTKPKAGDRRWWEECGDRAIETGQWGLAEACFDQAAEISPEMYYDPPARVQGILAQVEAHLDIVRG